MHPVSMFIVFIMVWWSVLFCVLPVGLATTYENVDEGEENSAPGAPKTLNMKKKLKITTMISFVLWTIICLVIESDVIDFKAWALQD
ncbi:MAG: hypothetical protein COB36_05770 [Alphaproteobacteria bacterium]|nr:MAG: hypothetical protein COB36_05770 [Alphaproteobacteria bacterium]